MAGHLLNAILSAVQRPALRASALVTGSQPGKLHNADLLLELDRALVVSPHGLRPGNKLSPLLDRFEDRLAGLAEFCRVVDNPTNNSGHLRRTLTTHDTNRNHLVNLGHQVVREFTEQLQLVSVQEIKRLGVDHGEGTCSDIAFHVRCQILVTWKLHSTEFIDHALNAGRSHILGHAFVE